MEMPDELLAAGRRLSAVVEGQVAVPDDKPLTQLIWATVMRSKRTFDAISHMVGKGFDTQAAMLSRALFEDMIVVHWLDLNRDDSDWLVERFFTQRDALTLDQLDMNARYPFATGPFLVSDVDDLRRRQNQIRSEFRGRATSDWWDPGEDGRGHGRPERVVGIAKRLEEAAANHIRFDPRFAGGEAELLRNTEHVIVNWFSRQLHHTAIGLPFQPQRSGSATLVHDELGIWRTFFAAYWTYGQSVYLLHEHLGFDTGALGQVFIEGLIAIGTAILPEDRIPEALARIRPWNRNSGSD